jgi:hypothetical protein
MYHSFFKGLVMETTLQYPFSQTKSKLILFIIILQRSIIHGNGLVIEELPEYLMLENKAPPRIQERRRSHSVFGVDTKRLQARQSTISL